jgi:2-amino-4-hydroxy-6-hydroxymethyldihydropteridine diphosphokinase
MNAALAYIGLGANLGQPETTLHKALEAINEWPGVQTLVSSGLYRSAPVNAPGPVYTNAVAAIRTTLAPLPLLAALREIEVAFGRERHFRNAPRTLDLDLLLYETLCFQTPSLTVPHPRMHERAFVLKPLQELAGHNLMIGRQNIAQWLALCSDQACEPIEQNPQTIPSERI